MRKLKMKLLSKILFMLLWTPVVLDDPYLRDIEADVVSETLTILNMEHLPVKTKRLEPKPESINLYLYNRSVIIDPIEFNINSFDKVDTTKKVVVLIHGFLSGARLERLQELKNSYLLRYDCNVLMVQWEEYAFSLYSTAVYVVPTIARMLGNFLCRLSKEKNYALENIHIIGHSLGAHMAGFIGKTVKKRCRHTIGRITGLDPAGPLYFSKFPAKRLDRTDANFVDVIHTNGGVFGYLTSMGHVDFYPNCGILQFCNAFDLSLKGILDLPVSVVTCHHSMSIDYMTESVRTDNFKGIPCKGCPLFFCPPLFHIFDEDKPIMGENCPNTTRGDYYVLVNTRKPFAISIF